MKGFKIAAIIFTVITAICLAIFLSALFSMVFLSSFENDQLIPIILLSLTGMAIFGPATIVAMIPMIIFWSLFGKRKRNLAKK